MNCTSRTERLSLPEQLYLMLTDPETGEPPKPRRRRTQGVLANPLGALRHARAPMSLRAAVQTLARRLFNVWLAIEGDPSGRMAVLRQEGTATVPVTRMPKTGNQVGMAVGGLGGTGQDSTFARHCLALTPFSCLWGQPAAWSRCGQACGGRETRHDETLFGPGTKGMGRRFCLG